MTGYTDKHEYTNKNGVKSVVYLMDCMDAMAQMRDKEFDLACVDPPYGIEAFKKGLGGTRFDKHKRGNMSFNNNVPTDMFFDGLFRVSHNQIVFGANNFVMPPSEYFLIWNKHQTVENFASAEYAWVSMGLKKPAKVFDYSIHKHNQNCDKIHPTEKPIALYDWIFKNYAKPKDTIFDSHLGSGSSRIAADRADLPFTGVELDHDYFRDHCKRFDRYTAQLTIF